MNHRSPNVDAGFVRPQHSHGVPLQYRRRYHHAMTSTIYLDHNATTPPLPEVVDEVARVMRECSGNPGSRNERRYGQARKVSLKGALQW